MSLILVLMGGEMVSCLHKSTYSFVRFTQLILAPLPPTDLAYAHIPLQVENKNKREKPDLTEDELLIASPILVGFSLADKLWCKHFCHVSTIS
jgi:hypothetical protein